jgi:hypothetical protein
MPYITKKQTSMDMGVNFDEIEGRINEEKPIIWQGKNAILREEKKWLLVVDFPNSEKASVTERETEFKPKQKVTITRDL